MIVILCLVVQVDVGFVVFCVVVVYVLWIVVIGCKFWLMIQDYYQVIVSDWVFIVEYDGQLVGLLVIWEIVDGFFVDNFVVFFECKGQGIG